MAGDFQDELAFAHELADLADAVTLPAFHRGLDVETKEDGTPVTAADREAERVMRAAIRARFPGHAVLGEEDGLDGPEGAPTWILDPIDGTKNFITGMPVYGTLIALQVEGEGVVGVCSAPALGTRWDGVAGGGARQDGRPIRVSDVTRLAEAQVCFGGLNYFADRGLLGVVERLATQTGRQRGFGDFWQHCLVASGHVEAALEAAVSLWDLAAIQVIVEAAGGRFTSLAGERTASGGDTISSNGHLHEAALALVGDASTGA